MAVHSKPLPEAVFSENFRKRFWSKVSKRSESECWNWNASFRSTYGAIKVAGEVVCAHRVAYVLAYGEPSPELIIGHKCDNRKCCNPKHLEAITRKQNHNDAVDRGGIKLPIGDLSHSTSINSELAHAICLVRVQEGIGAIRIAKKLGVSVRAVKGIIQGETWRSIASQYGIPPKKCGGVL